MRRGATSRRAFFSTRYSSLGYSPDPFGDLVYNGIRQQAARSAFSTGSQSDITWRLADAHTIRIGYQFYVERTTSKSDSQVYRQTGSEPSGAPLFDGSTVSIHDGNGSTGWMYGLYAQDEWRPTHDLTVNYGARFDGVAEYTKAQQISPRLNIVWRAWPHGMIHAGYARYFTPPAFELISTAAIARFDGTSNAPVSLSNDRPKAERDHYVDVGASQTLLPHWHVSLDAYLKLARNLLDEGQFGSPVILSVFNYRRGQVNGYELSTDYQFGPLSLYGNASWSRAIGKKVVSSQWLMNEEDLAYGQHRWIPLDHDQRWTASAGGSYAFFCHTAHPTHVSGSMVYGSGLRADGLTPNGRSVPIYATFNLSLVQTIKNRALFSLPGTTELRLDVLNLFDKTYIIRDGSGIGVGAPQFGLRRTIYAGLSEKL